MPLGGTNWLLCTTVSLKPITHSLVMKEWMVKHVQINPGAKFAKEILKSLKYACLSIYINI